jgi:hypothetical protein
MEILFCFSGKVIISSPPIMSNSDMIKGTYKQTAIPKSYSTGTSMCDMVKQDDNPEYTGNESWSDLTKSMDSHHIKKRASMDSDITILTNDRSSIAVISESSIETLAENQSDDVFGDKSENKAYPNPHLSLPVGKFSHSPSQSSDVEVMPRKLAELSEESVVLTPIGSPLSSSICSSMVSSIYENTVTSPSTENIHQESITGNPYQNCDNGRIDNNNGREESIFDNHTGTNNNDKLVPSDDINGSIDNRRLPSYNSDGFVPTETSTLNEDNSIYDNSANFCKDSQFSNLDVLKSYCDIDFTKIDHRLKLFLTMNFLEENDTEKLQCAFKVFNNKS